MSSSTMNIPKILNVGYQKRCGTYTEKLAYVVYTDAKGKLRKETSWKSWCDDKIPKDIFDNVPTEGFVLNKNTGGVGSGWGWNDRIARVRVYDPRDFEFEISIPNLLFILQECSSIKGKGLEGEFVYAWEGKELVLLPCDSTEYKECVKYTAAQSLKVTKNDIIEGCTYQMKDMNDVMYLGRHSWFEKAYNWKNEAEVYYLTPRGKKHIFVNIKSLSQAKPAYYLETGFTRIAKRTSDKAIPEYADAYEKLINSVNCLLPTKVIFKELNLNKPYIDSGVYCFIQKGDKYYSAYISKQTYYNHDNNYVIAQAKKSFTIPSIKNGSVNINTVYYRSWRDGINDTYPDKELELVPKHQLLERTFYTAHMINSKGSSYNLLTHS